MVGNAGQSKFYVWLTTCA